MSSDTALLSVDKAFKDGVSKLVDVIRQHYHALQPDAFIPLHAPCFDEQEKRLLNDCIDSTFVSSVGKYVDEFERNIAQFTQAKHAVAVVNGTLGLFLALKVVGVQSHDLVLTQSLTFVATANAIKMLDAHPLFLDVSKQTYSLCPQQLESFLSTSTYQKEGACFHKQTDQRIAACVPMHTLGFSADIEAIVSLCHQHNIKVVEDAAESLGSYYAGQHTGTFGDIGVFSFNGNKIITTGGGGMLITNNPDYAKHAKHLSTTAKIPHAWLFEHDEIGYNLRMPNLNAALGVAQMKKLPNFLEEKSVLNQKYQSIIADLPGMVALSNADKISQPNNWLMGVVCDTVEQRDYLLQTLNAQSIQVRPLWTPMHQLAIYKNEQDCSMQNTEWLAERVINLPSGVICHKEVAPL